MTIRNKREALLLFFGDSALFFIALWVMLFLRYLAIPTTDLFYAHVIPFGVLYLVWITVFFISGLYGKHTALLKNKLPSTILNTQIINSVIAVGFFYFIPYFGITPKTNLFIYLGVSFIFILLWRIYGHELLGFRKKHNALLVGSGKEMRELHEEVRNNPRYNLTFTSSLDLDEIEHIDFQTEIIERIYAEGISIVVINLRNEKIEPILPHLYNLMFRGIRFIDMHQVYEDIFDRVPVSLLKDSWFLENISLSQTKVYDILKRAMDILFASILGAFSLLFYPVIALAIKLDDGGTIFYNVDRIGENNKHVRITKFRSMTGADSGDEVLESKNTITRIGAFMRRVRIDELPQLWDVVQGDLSLIGPRPELPALAEHYGKTIPYYNIRHLIKPGLSGWAQLYHDNHPHHGTNEEATREKLAYDLYYIKNRSLMLDVKVALKTLRIILSRGGI